MKYEIEERGLPFSANVFPKAGVTLFIKVCVQKAHWTKTVPNTSIKCGGFFYQGVKLHWNFLLAFGSFLRTKFPNWSNVFLTCLNWWTGNTLKKLPTYTKIYYVFFSAIIFLIEKKNLNKLIVKKLYGCVTLATQVSKKASSCCRLVALY